MVARFALLAVAALANSASEFEGTSALMLKLKMNQIVPDTKYEVENERFAVKLLHNGAIDGIAAKLSTPEEDGEVTWIKWDSQTVAGGEVCTSMPDNFTPLERLDEKLSTIVGAKADETRNILSNIFMKTSTASDVEARFFELVKFLAANEIGYTFGRDPNSTLSAVDIVRERIEQGLTPGAQISFR